MIRPAEPGDLEAIVEIFFDCWTTSYAQSLPVELIDRMDRRRARELWSKALANPNTTVEVAMSSTAVIGVVGYGLKADGRGYVASLYVSPTAQGGGHGRRLLDHATAELISQGASDATLWVFEQNHPSRKFYQQQGWEPDGERLVDPDFGQPQIQLTKRLAPEPSEDHAR